MFEIPHHSLYFLYFPEICSHKRMYIFSPFFKKISIMCELLALPPLLLCVKYHQRFQFERVTETGNVLLCIVGLVNLHHWNRLAVNVSAARPSLYLS